MLLGKINGAIREDSSTFFLTNSNDTTSKFVIKVCNHPFTLNFYITEVSHVVQVRAEGPGLRASALYLCFTLRPAIFNSATRR